VTCHAVKVRKHGHVKTRNRCTTKLVSGSVKFTIPAKASSVHATLSRGSRTYARGSAGRRGIVLHAVRSVPRGHYTLRLSYRNAGGLRTIHRGVTVT
jgi:hypothetical protein